MTSSYKFSQVAIALGSNLGDSLNTMKTALKILSQMPGIQIKSKSSFYRTPPIGPPQPDYLNACALLMVELTPEDLLELLLQIEAKFGRERRERWEARTLDLDLLLFNNLIWKTANLELPHPRMRERGFVLVPLAEIAPDWIDPVTGRSIEELVKLVDISGIEKMY